MLYDDWREGAGGRSSNVKHKHFLFLIGAIPRTFAASLRCVTGADVSMAWRGPGRRVGDSTGILCGSGTGGTGGTGHWHVDP